MEIKKQIFNFNRIEHLISFKQNNPLLFQNMKKLHHYKQRRNLKKL